MTRGLPPPPPPPLQPRWAALPMPQTSPRANPPSAPATAPLHPGAVGTFAGNEQPADCSTHDDIAGCIMGDEDDDEI
ncbi:hypothetical protein BDA96_09G026300 [Sorghum bicolor]|uniref:Uncharacterized protein n=2 Tax=Sorghum bicolor TaxID=4558 RepID=A0A921U3K2_SORBI|nr:hypothetical protein BDA96_09G026300 [Sorghum bicolor]KXG21171.1 hypothetical protein SORBI_3009G025000 [Sorghum bicolor]